MKRNMHNKSTVKWLSVIFCCVPLQTDSFNCIQTESTHTTTGDSKCRLLASGHGGGVIRVQYPRQFYRVVQQQRCTEWFSSCVRNVCVLCCVYNCQQHKPTHAAPRRVLPTIRYALTPKCVDTFANKVRSLSVRAGAHHSHIWWGSFRRFKCHTLPKRLAYRNACVARVSRSFITRINMGRIHSGGTERREAIIIMQTPPKRTICDFAIKLML